VTNTYAHIAARIKGQGGPVQYVFDEPVITYVHPIALLKAAPHPNAAKLFYAFLFSKDTQQLISDVGGLRSFHPEVKEKEGRTPLSKIKLLYSDPAKLEPMIEDIKKKYEEYFGT